MGVALPKQYLPLRGRALMCHTLQRLAAVECIGGIVVALDSEDRHWREINLGIGKPLFTVAGGAERCHSVLNALEWLLAREQVPEWVLVHDAARPCVRVADVERLVAVLSDSRDGGLLGAPLSDTIKQADVDGCVAATVDRNGLWRALTPQMFRLRPLRDAIAGALASGELVTDEAAAMELAGHTPRLVEGSADNIKVTRPADLAMAEFFLQQQESSGCE